MVKADIEWRTCKLNSKDPEKGDAGNNEPFTFVKLPNRSCENVFR